MSSGETVAITFPAPSPGSTASSELGSCCACVPATVAPPWAWLLAPDRLDAAPAPAGAAAVVEDEAGALAPPIPAIWATGGAANWPLELVVEEAAGALVVTAVVTDSAAAWGDATLSGLFVWGRSEAVPTTNSAMARPATAPTKNPPLLKPSSPSMPHGFT